MIKRVAGSTSTSTSSSFLVSSCCIATASATAATTTALVMFVVVLFLIGAVGTTTAAQLSSSSPATVGGALASDQQQHLFLPTTPEHHHHHKTRHHHHHHNSHHHKASSSSSTSNESAGDSSSSSSGSDDYSDQMLTEDVASDYPAADGGSQHQMVTMQSNCSTCVAGRDELRRRNLELIKDQILSKLGMRQAPNMTGRLPPRIPPLDHLLDLYGMQSDGPSSYSSSSSSRRSSSSQQQQQQPFHPGPVYDEEEDDFHARTEKVIAFAQNLPLVSKALKKVHGSGSTESSSSAPPSKSAAAAGATTTTTATAKGMESMYFKFSDKVTRTSKVDKAHLWLYLNGASSPTIKTAAAAAPNVNVSVWIHVYKVVRVNEDGESPVLNPVRSTKVALQAEKGGWVSLEMRKVVADWFRFPEDNRGLVVHAVLNNDDPSAAAAHMQHKTTQQLVVIDSQSDPSLMPFVEVVTSDSRKHRTKRTIGLNCDETSIETRCCRYPLTVDFVEFGWDWIIAPKKYEANYCSGECPYVFLQKYPHTHIVQQANPAGTAGPCCAPRKMSSISMLYFDNEFNIIYGNLPGMVVDRCGCS